MKQAHFKEATLPYCDLSFSNSQGCSVVRFHGFVDCAYAVAHRKYVTIDSRTDLDPSSCLIENDELRHSYRVPQRV